MLYADDTTIFTSSTIACNIQANLDRDLQRLNTWFDKNGLKVNPGKTEFILFSNNRIRERFNHIKIAVNGKLIQEKEQVKILGVTLTNNLKWDTHTNNLINSLKYHYRSFSRSCRLLTIDTRKLLYNAAIASRMNYCDMVWDCCNLNVKKKLQSVQNRCARRILNQLPGSSSAPLFRKLGWIRLDQKRKLHKCVLLHKVINGKGPKILLDMLSPLMEHEGRSMGTRGSTNEHLSMPLINTDYLKKSFVVDTAKSWNNIPLELRLINSSLSFKNKLQTFYLTEYSAGLLPPDW